MNISKSKGSRNAGSGTWCALQLGNVCGVLIPLFHQKNLKKCRALPSLLSDIIHRIKTAHQLPSTYIIQFGFVLAVLPSHFFPSHLLSVLFILGLNFILILVFHFVFVLCWFLEYWTSYYRLCAELSFSSFYFELILF